MKKIEDIEFGDDILFDYKKEIEEINSMCEQLEKDKKFQKKYKKFLKKRKKLTVNYNRIDERFDNYVKTPKREIRIKIKNQDSISYDPKFNGKFC